MSTATVATESGLDDRLPKLSEVRDTLNAVSREDCIREAWLAYAREFATRR